MDHLPLAAFLFPDGRLASPPWRWVLWAYAILSGVVLADAFAPAIAAVAEHDIRLNSTADVDTSHLRGWLVHTPAPVGLGQPARTWRQLTGSQ